MGKDRFSKILIANRGEIALRIIRTIHSLGMNALVVHSSSDRELPFVQEADEAFLLGSGSLAETYLDQSKILGIARKAGADAIHPGYGFLAENAEFAEGCRLEGITFIGPDPEAIRIMGDKIRAREKARELGLPLLEGFTGSPGELAAQADKFPFPVLIKPSAGGGGKGMRIIHRAEEFEDAAFEASREAENYFGSGGLYVEEFLVNPRHIEVQVLADQHGNSVHLFERECSIQRRYQKIIEEAPSVSVSAEGRKLITDSALKLVRGMEYTNAGTVEFLMDDSGSFYFLEMNTRIQVEHPVTEMITGIDLVKEQIRIAMGDKLSFSQDDLQIRGHAIEARIYAEDPMQDFWPSAGTIEKFLHPDGQETRIDSGYQEGNRIEPFYDPMIAKVIRHGTSRTDAINKLIDSLKGIYITGLNCNRDYLISLLQTGLFTQNQIHTRLVELESRSILQAYQKSRDKLAPEILLAAAAFISLQPDNSGGKSWSSPWKAIGYWRLLPEISILYQGNKHLVKYEAGSGRKKMILWLEGAAYHASLEVRSQEYYRVRINKHVLSLRASTSLSEINLDIDGHMYTLRRPDRLDERYIKLSGKESSGPADRIVAPLNGRIIKINIKEGDKVEKDQPLLLIESMKMENKILAPHKSIIKESHVSVGEQVQNTQLLFTLDTNDRSSDQ